MKNITPVLVLHNIQPVNDGATYAVMLRADALAEKILLILLNKELRQELSKNARLITQQLTVEKFKESWIGVLS